MECCISIDRVTDLCEGNSPVTGEFPAQWASNAENISILCRHHAKQGTAQGQGRVYPTRAGRLLIYGFKWRIIQRLKCAIFSIYIFLNTYQKYIHVSTDLLCENGLTNICRTSQSKKYFNETPGQPIRMTSMVVINSLRPKLNRRHFADDIFKCIFLNENERILPRISLKYVPKVRINNSPALVQIMAWCRPWDKPLSELMLVSLLTHICVTRPKWVKVLLLLESE